MCVYIYIYIYTHIYIFVYIYIYKYEYVSSSEALFPHQVDSNPLLALLPLELGVLPKLAEVAYDSETVSEPCTQFHGDLATLLWAMKTMHLSRSSNTLDLSARALVSLPNEV